MRERGDSQGMKAQAIGKKAVRATKSTVNYMALIVIVLLVAYAGYALWDSNQVHQAADKSNYAVYKPTVANRGKTFKELQALNSETFAWLSVYGTNIDYPVTQGQDNTKYVSTNAEGLYSLSGSIFLDCNNSRDFSDFNSILYGHHMAKKAMFGELESFSEKSAFESHRYGKLYFNEKEHGIEFFAFVHADAYDSKVFTPNVQADDCLVYLDGLLAKAIYTRDIVVTGEDHIILLSTCSSSSTNGRDILVGRLTDEVYDGLSVNATTGDGLKQPDSDDRYCLVEGIPIRILLPVSILAILPIACVLGTYHIWMRHKKEQKQR